ncbi:GntR family transcriptional regulator [Luethyella okanaganae]|uniref:GntR family transcriptional regulator n=1 Tax=Luethyella okanaganae TaxID=69372 RepID=A0ABW1VC98_9MICO
MANRPTLLAPGESIRDRTLQLLRARIISLELAPGASLSENELAAELGISRTPVRESLILLREEGLIQVFPQLGTFVSRVDPGRVAQAQFVREAIECASLREAETVDPESLQALQANIREQHAANEAGDIDGFFALDEEFHRRLLRATGHESAWNTVNAAKAHLDRARRLSLIDARPVSSLIEQHARIVDALSEQDTTNAVESLRAHLRAVFDDVERIRQRSPELFSDGGGLRPVRRTLTVLP